VLVTLIPAGEFCVRVVGTVRLPRPAEAVRLTAENKKGVTRELAVGVKNPHLERARAAVLEVLGKEAGVALLRHVRRGGGWGWRGVTPGENEGGRGR
jgi:hypothetical protein